MSENARDSVEHELSVYEHTVIYAKLAAGMLALTYMAGYLVATSYLETYGIHLDSSESFRAKYIYIGLLYWLFFSIFAVTALLVKKYLDFFKLPTKPKSTKEVEKQRKLQQQEESDRLQWELKNSESDWERDRSEFLWDYMASFIVYLILVVFSFQILLLNQGSLPHYLLLQAFFLINVLVFQVSYHWPLSKETYSVGNTDVKRYVEILRWFLFIILLLTAVFIIAEILNGKPYEWTSHLLKCPILIYLVPALYGVMAGLLTNRSTVMTKDTFSNGQPNKKLERISSGILGFMIGFYLWFALMGHETAITPPSAALLWSTIGRGILVLLLALMVLWNILGLSIMKEARDKTVREARGGAMKETTDGTISRAVKWEWWVKRIIPVVVLYIVSVLGFAYFIYPFIPVEKSGGNYMYTHELFVRLVQTTSAGACPDGSLPSDNDTYYLLEEDMNWVYLAKADAGGPKYWRFGAIYNKYRPKVYTIKRSCVADMETEDQKTNK